MQEIPVTNNLMDSVPQNTDLTGVSLERFPLAMG